MEMPETMRGRLANLRWQSPGALVVDRIYYIGTAACMHQKYIPALRHPSSRGRLQRLRATLHFGRRDDSALDVDRPNENA